MRLEDVWRAEAPHVLAALLRRFGDLGDCDDAVQEAFIAAARQWPTEGVPDSPRGWLIRVASRRLIDARRSETARHERERADAERDPADSAVWPPADEARDERDDRLRLLVLCAHPSLTSAGQLALMLRAVAGLSTPQIASAFLVPEATMAQRISRAKSTLREAGARFALPSAAELPARVAIVVRVLLLVFNEGHTTSAGTALLNGSIADDAIRLTRELHALVPDDDEVAGALALMLLTHARVAARETWDGDLVPLAEQNRALWNPALIAEGVQILERVLPRGAVGPLQLQAAIAAVHAETIDGSPTDWEQIAVLYGMLAGIDPSPVVTLHRAVAVGEAVGPDAGLALVEPLTTHAALRRHHRTWAVRAHLLERAGRRHEAHEDFLRAADLTRSIPEQRYLLAAAERVAS